MALIPIHDPPSPTSLEIGAAINVLTKMDFSTDWSILKEDYSSNQNASLRVWFKQINRVPKEYIKKEWIKDMEGLKVNFPLFMWFPTFGSKQGMQDIRNILALMFKQISSNMAFFEWK